MRAHARLVLVFCLLVTSLSNAASEPRRVGNREYRFSAIAPTGTVTCMEGSGGHLHGFSIMLDPPKEGCQGSPPQPYIGLFGDYNAAEAKTPAHYLSHLCPLQHPSFPVPKKTSLVFPGHDSMACQSTDKNGWIDVFVVTMASKWPDAKDNPTEPDVPYMLYTAQLHTNPARRTRDLVTFRNVL